MSVNHEPQMSGLPLSGYLEAHYASGDTGLFPVCGSSPAQLREAARVMSRTHQIRVNVLATDKALVMEFINGTNLDSQPEPTRTSLWKTLRTILRER